MGVSDEFVPPKVEYDASGRFVRSFELDEVEAYCKHFQEYGFVVVDNVLTEEECAASREEVWTYLKEKADVDENDATTWQESNWPKEICRNGGFVGKFPYWKRMSSLDHLLLQKQPQLWRNLENPNVYGVMANVLQKQKLWVSIDRYGIMRPNKKSVVVEESWSTKKNWLHWDLSPFHYGTSAAGFAPNPNASKEELSKDFGSTRIQGLVTLTECQLENGGFHCVPGFQNETFLKWGDEHRDGYGNLEEIRRRNFVEVPLEDPMRSMVVKVPMRKGSLIVWNSQLPHGNFPNNSDQFRMVQYIKMIPVEDSREFLPAIPCTDFDRAEWFPPTYTPSPLGEKLFGLKSWDDDDTK